MPPGLVAWNGYAMPTTVRTHRREDLVAIAAANGLHLSPDLLHKWRYWRLVPGPTPGGSTGKGRGKGQTWPHGAAWRVAWVSRWLTDSLTYDVLRLAIWPWTSELERNRIEMVRGSIGAFLAQDQDFHARTWEKGLSEAEQDELDPYLNLMDGDHRSGLVSATLSRAGITPDHPRLRRHEALVRRLSFDELLETAQGVMDEELSAFISRVRTSDADLRPLFWDSPLTLARILVRELHRAHLDAGGAIQR